MVTADAAPGTITIEQASDLDTPRTSPRSGDLGTFVLDYDADGSEPTIEDFPDLAPGDYTVTQGEVEHWDFVGIDCGPATFTTDDPNRSVTISLAPGEGLHCIFTNSAHDGTITIDEESDPADGTAFQFTSSTGTTTPIVAFEPPTPARSTPPATPSTH